MPTWKFLNQKQKLCKSWNRDASHVQQKMKQGAYVNTNVQTLGVTVFSKMHMVRNATLGDADEATTTNLKEFLQSVESLDRVKENF